MNKKLFSWKALAGFALLAAISMTSCNTDDPINPTNPSGVNPTAASHYVGGEYDWTAIAKNLTQLQEFWNADKDKVATLLKDNKDKTVDVLLDVSGFELDNATIFTLPDFWGTGATSGNVVNITFRGNFKKADFERASAIKGDGKAFPVKIKTDNVKGAEVNFIFDAEAIDLELATTLTRSTITSTGLIGWFKADAATANSATIIKGGSVVEGIDNASTGDIKEEDNSVLGIWVTVAPASGTLYATEKGFQVGNGDGYIYAENVIAECNFGILTQYKWGSSPKFFEIDQLAIVKENAEVTLLDAKPTIASIKGIKNNTKVILNGSEGLANIGSIEKATVQYPYTLLLTKDVYTDVIFDCDAYFYTEDVYNFENVEFKNYLSIYFSSNNVRLDFSGVNFRYAPGLYSDIEVENTTATTSTTYYQWEISDADPTQGQYVSLKADMSDLKEYNKGKEVGEFSYDLYNEKLYFVANATSGYDVYGDDASKAKLYNVIKLNVTTPAGKTTIIPEGTVVNLDGSCKFWDSTDNKYQKTDRALNYIWGNKNYLDENCWYSVIYNDVPYVWKKQSGYSSRFILVPVKD